MRRELDWETWIQDLVWRGYLVKTHWCDKKGSMWRDSEFDRNFAHQMDMDPKVQNLAKMSESEKKHGSGTTWSQLKALARESGPGPENVGANFGLGTGFSKYCLYSICFWFVILICGGSWGRFRHRKRTRCDRKIEMLQKMSSLFWLRNRLVLKHKN